MLNKYLLYINIFFLQSYLIRFHLGPYPSNLQEILIFCLLSTFIFTVIKEKRIIQTIKNITKHWILLSFAGLTIFSYLTADIENQLDFIRYIKFLFFAIILVFIFLETLKTPEERKKGIQIMGYGALVFGVFSAFYNLGGFNIAHDLRLQGPLDAAVYLAYYLTPFFIFFVTESFEKKKKENIIPAILLGILILLTRSMGAIGGSFLVILIYLFKSSNLAFLKTKSVKIILILTAITIGSWTFYSKILPAFQTNYSSLNERNEIWQTSANLLKEPGNFIFGLGFGQFQQNYSDNVKQIIGRTPLDYIVLQPHNIFFLFIFNYGILGLILLIYIIFRNLKIVLSRNDKENLILTCIVSYFLLHGLIDTPLFKNDLLILFILFLQLAYPNFKPETKPIKAA